jgi:transposase
MKKIARTLRTHRTLLLNYFKTRKEFSSGVGEGLNNKAKLTMRKAYSFHTFHVLELLSITRLASCPSRNQPTIFSDESPSWKLRRAWASSS